MATESQMLVSLRWSHKVCVEKKYRKRKEGSNSIKSDSQKNILWRTLSWKAIKYWDFLTVAAWLWKKGKSSFKAKVADSIGFLKDISLKFLLNVTVEIIQQHVSRYKLTSCCIFPIAQNYSFPVPYVHKVNMTPMKDKQINIHGFMLFIVRFMSDKETFSSFLSAIHFWTIIHLKSFSWNCRRK